VLWCERLVLGEIGGWIEGEGVVSGVVFFFQAEDGIRDRTVTGVQTCALPISVSLGVAGDDGRRVEAHGLVVEQRDVELRRVIERSEERRVGKECRCRWAPDQ